MRDKSKAVSIVLAPALPIAACQAVSRKLKWARCQGAVTFPWPRAHSILKRIGGDNFILRQPVEMSRTNRYNLLNILGLRAFREYTSTA